MPNLVALSLMVSDKEIFKDVKFFKVLLPWQPEFFKESIFFKNSEEDHGRNISVKFHQNRISIFREDVKKKKLTDEQMDTRQTTDHDISSLAYRKWS